MIIQIILVDCEIRLIADALLCHVKRWKVQKKRERKYEKNHAQCFLC